MSKDNANASTEERTVSEILSHAVSTTWIPDEEFFSAPAVDLAPLLLGKILCKGESCLLISEVEAYGGADDEASHAFRGSSARNSAMFEQGGHLYVYLSYGVHKCINVVAGPRGSAMAVLVRAGVPVEFGQEVRGMDVQSPISGPGRVGRYFDASVAESGLDLLRSSGWRFTGSLTQELTSEFTTASTRIGISKAIHEEWRFQLDLSRMKDLPPGRMAIGWTSTGAGGSSNGSRDSPSLDSA